MAPNQPASPEGYAVRYVTTTMVKPRVHSAFIAERYPVENFRVWPEGTVDTEDYSKGANVSVESRYTADGRAVGSVVTAVVYAEEADSPQRVTIQSDMYVPPLSLELENKVPSNERTLNILLSVAAQAVMATTALQKVSSENV